MSRGLSRIRGLVPGLVLLLTVTGVACRGGPGDPDREGSGASLEPVSFAEWQEKLGAMRGGILVVDHWATWCLPCLERFPHMVELHREYNSRNVTFVSLCLDDRDDAEAVERAGEYLSDQGATFPNFLMDENLFEAFEVLDLLGLPVVDIYDASGTLRFHLTADDPNDQFTDEQVEEAIRELLAEEAPV